MSCIISSPILFLFLLARPYVFAGMDSCHGEEGTASVCMPKFENAAFNRSVKFSNACGSPPEDYCMQTGSTRSCRHCDASDPETNHNATYLNDFHSDEEPTWWQSQSMFYGVQYPNSVNLTLQLGKTYEITYVRLKFYTSRPESFAIYKRTNETAPWQPYQYYSASCDKTYGKDSKGFIRPGEEERTALCTDEFSDISPLTGGNVAFSTLEGRPSAYNFDQSPVLQEWVTATDLLISLNRLNTFGDEFFKDAKVLRSYFYAISDFSVGGRCKCNGHASECVPNERGRLVCVCEHYTAGTDCQHCAPFYRDRPWARATADSANQCIKCNCSGRADECVFDPELYRGTGSGGRCVGCRENTAGPHCERCNENYYRSSPLLPCNDCSCNTMGSVSLQCDAEGACQCRPSVMGFKCDVCKPGFHSLGPGGCRSCACDERGSTGVCSAGDGRCRCKSNVEGHSCDRCKPGSFNLQADNPQGCQTCFCFGHSRACASSSQHVAFNISSNFLEDTDGWLGEFSGHHEAPLIWKEGEVYLLPYNEEDAGYYKAPAKFLGNQLLSYGRDLTLSFTAESRELLPKTVTVDLEGSRTSVRATLISKLYVYGHAPHNIFTLRLTETEVNPSLAPFEFRRLLTNLTALHISNVGGQNYTSQLSGVALTSATLPDSDSSGPLAPPAQWVEVCACPLGFTGQFCERCEPGFTRANPNDGSYSPCVPCDCNQHGMCHPETGVCDCTDFTTGPTCERCKDGYYGNALTGSPGDCAPCPCPGRTTCARVPETREVVCTNCPAGQRGTRCELCEDGFFGDPLGWNGEARLCVKCECNGNTDPNAVGVCDHVTGHCLKCLGHTDGDRCEKCQSGYYGNALDRNLRPSQKCLPCVCNPTGSLGSEDECDPRTGRCLCLRHVTGRNCGQCEFGYFNLQPGLGCDSCNCNPIGSSSPGCHPITGQCTCRAGIEGKICDACQMGFFGFSSRGCRACNCDPMGSASMQCHTNGTCPCRPGFVGYKCDKCELNHYQNPLNHQCEECPVCYSLIRDQATKLKSQLYSLERLLSNYDCRGFRHRIYVRPNPVRLHPRHDDHLHEHQGEDYLPNALEDFLAIHEAREAFISQFAQLETSAQALKQQLDDFASIMNCSLLEEGGSVSSQDVNTMLANECRVLVDTFAAVTETHSRLRKMPSDLNSLVIPFIIPKVRTEWNALVNESEALVKSHKEMAAHIEGLAMEALNKSNRTYSMLQDLLDDNSTQRHFKALTARLSEMQQLKENLTRQANETQAALLSAEEQNKKAEAAIRSVSAAFQQHMDGASDPPNTTSAERLSGAYNTMTQELIQTLDLANRTNELDLLIESKGRLLNKTREELELRVQDAHNKLNTSDKFPQLTAHALGLRETALTSVVEGKEIESEAFSLHRHIGGLEKEWPVLHTQTRAALKREGIVEGKFVTEVKKKVKQAERALDSALGNATQASDTATLAEKTANSVAKDAKAAQSKGKQTRKASAQQSAAVNAAVQQLTEQEKLAARVEGDVRGEADVSLKAMMGSMEAAKSQLEGFSHMLTTLLGQIENNTDVKKYGRVLNETEARLRVLRGSVESLALNRKFQILLGAAEAQQEQLKELEKNLQDIREERDSLHDIAQNLPKTCPERS